MHLCRSGDNVEKLVARDDVHPSPGGRFDQTSRHSARTDPGVESLPGDPEYLRGVGRGHERHLPRYADQEPDPPAVGQRCHRYPRSCEYRRRSLLLGRPQERVSILREHRASRNGARVRNALSVSAQYDLVEMLHGGLLDRGEATEKQSRRIASIEACQATPWTYMTPNEKPRTGPGASQSRARLNGDASSNTAAVRGTSRC